MTRPGGWGLRRPPPLRARARELAVAVPRDDPSGACFQGALRQGVQLEGCEAPSLLVVFSLQSALELVVYDACGTLQVAAHIYLHVDPVQLCFPFF
jgi:hypothetical protein